MEPETLLRAILYGIFGIFGAVAVPLLLQFISDRAAARLETGSDSVVATAAATLSRQRFLQPLRALCVRKIALSLKFYVDSGVTSLHSHLLPKLCEEVSESYVKQLGIEREKLLYYGRTRGQDDAASILYHRLPNRELFKIASLFVGARLKHVDVTALRIPYKNGGYLEEWNLFFDRLVEEAPKLGSLHFQISRFELDFPYILLPPSQFIRGLERMSSLRKLKIGSKLLIFKNADLQIVSTCCPMLQILDITLDFSVTNEEGLCHLQELKMLEHLVTSFDEPPELEWSIIHEKNIERTAFCLITLPKLKINGYVVGSDLDDINNYHSFSIFEENEDPVELGLEHLKLWKYLPLANVLLPHVTHLAIYGLQALHVCLKRSFPKLKVLVVHDVPLNDLLKLLRHLGNPLVKLDTSCIAGNPDLLVITSYCPQLECLSLSNVACVKYTASALMASRHFLDKMKDLELVLVCEDDGHINCMAAGLLKLLMTSCPDLENLYFNAFTPKAEVDEVAAGIAAGAYLCIPKIRSLTIINWPADDEESQLNFIKQVVAHCPQLDKILVNGSVSCRSNKFGPLKAILDKFNRGHVLRCQCSEETAGREFD